MTILVIVDMQSGFPAAKYCMDATLNLIKKAKRYHWTIIFLEYYDYEEILKPLLDETENYQKKLVLTKTDNDGSIEVEYALKYEHIKKANPKTIRICGVYTNCCVQATAQGLARKYKKSKIIIHQEACAGTATEEIVENWKKHIDWRWYAYAEQDNLYIVHQNKLISSKNKHEFSGIELKAS